MVTLADGDAATEVIEELPENYEWFSEQIAGHHPSVVKNGRREIGLLKSPGTKEILKPKQDADRGEREVALYELLSGQTHRRSKEEPSDGSDDGDDLKDTKNAEKNRLHTILGDCVLDDKNDFRHSRIHDVEIMRSLTPYFYEVRTLHVDGLDVDFMVLEDVTAPYRRPAILDLKIGRVTYDPQASAEKREKESTKYPPQAIMGCRILGYRIHRTDGDVVVRDKDWGRQFDEKTINIGLEEFFSGRQIDDASEHARSVVDVLQAALNALSPIRRFFATQTSFSFFASSLLFVYEVDPKLPINMRIVMIDFSHAFPSNGKLDENYSFGVESLDGILRRSLTNAQLLSMVV